MRTNNFIFLLPVFIAVFSTNLICAKIVSADIYMRVGRNGTVYFSNAPVSNGYSLYMSTGQNSYGGNFVNRLGRVAYRRIIFKACKKYNVNPKLIEAVIKVESGFNINAVSDKGAEGLMQLMPETQRLVDVSDPFSPYQNIYGGTKYLKSLIDKYNGNLPLALAAYNAGSKAVAKYGGIPPYSETRNYVEEVMDYYREK